MPERCAHCGEAIKPERFTYTRKNGTEVSEERWVHTSGPGGRRYCTYRPDSPVAAPEERVHV